MPCRSAADPGSTGQVMQFVVVPAVGPDPSTLPLNLVLPAAPALPPETVTRPLALIEQAGIGYDVDGNEVEGPVEALLGKGAAIGTVLAFMMSVIALSLPEMIILRQVLTVRLIAVFIGVVAIGSEKRQKWVVPLTGHLFGTGERRVRGYLKPVDRPGVATARANVGLENPGVDSLRVGAGTPYLGYACETVIEFVGKLQTDPTHAGCV